MYPLANSEFERYLGTRRARMFVPELRSLNADDSPSQPERRSQARDGGLGLPRARRHTGAVVRPGWGCPANETELLLFRRSFAAVRARQEELPEDTFTESAPPMQSSIWSVRKRVTQ